MIKNVWNWGMGKVFRIIKLDFLGLGNESECGKEDSEEA